MLVSSKKGSEAIGENLVESFFSSNVDWCHGSNSGSLCLGGFVVLRNIG